MGFLDDILGTGDPGVARTKRLDDAFRRSVVANASMFSAMARAGLDIGPQGREIIGGAKRMGLVTPFKSRLPRSVQGVPVRGQERTMRILEQLSNLFGGRVRNRKQALGVIPKLPRNTPDMQLGGIRPPSGGLRRTRIGDERGLFQDNAINDLLGLDFEDLLK